MHYFLCLSWCSAHQHEDWLAKHYNWTPQLCNLGGSSGMHRMHSANKAESAKFFSVFTKRGPTQRPTLPKARHRVEWAIKFRFRQILQEVLAHFKNLPILVPPPPPLSSILYHLLVIFLFKSTLTISLSSFLNQTACFQIFFPLKIWIFFKNSRTK